MNPPGKWFRLTCEGGTIETTRENQDRILLRRKGKGLVEYDPDSQYTSEEKKEGHERTHKLQEKNNPKGTYI